MNDIVMNVLLKALFAVLIAVVPVIANYLVKQLRAKQEQVLNEIDSKSFDDSINKAFDIVCMAVELIQQTYVDSLKAKGEFTIEAQRDAMQKCLDTVELLMNDELKEFIVTTYGDFYIQSRTMAESIIYQNKNK